MIPQHHHTQQTQPSNLAQTHLTTSSGAPVDNNDHILTAGPRGPALLQDFNFLNKIQKFDRERIPERAAHA